MSDKEKDYYKIFGIKYGASKDEIKKAYRKLSFKYHPDRNPNDKKAEEMFKLLATAYETLTGDSVKTLEYDFSRRGWVDKYGKLNQSEGNLGSKSSIVFLINHLKKSNKNLEKKHPTEVAALYIRNLIQHSRYDDNDKINSIFDYGATRIIFQVIKEKILTKKYIKKVIHHEFKKLQREALHTIEKHIEGIVKICEKIDIDPEPEIKILRPHALGHIWKYITRIVRYTPYYTKHNINPAHIYFELKKINETQEEKLKLTKSELKKRNHEIEKKLFSFFYSKLKSNIHMADNIYSAKWYLDMIKYICHLLGNPQRYPHVREKLIHKFSHQRRKGSFEEGILAYMDVIQHQDENEFRHQATHQNSAVKLLLAKNPT